VVTNVSRLDLSTFPDSPYAAELQRVSSKLGFAAPLEAEYLRNRLSNSRTLIRVASVLTALMAVCRGIEQIWLNAWSVLPLLALSLVIAGSVALAWIAWSPEFEERYLQWAQSIVPLRNALLAVQMANVAAQGQPEMLMLLPITLIGPYFFLGLPFRPALLCCLSTVVTYAAAAYAYALPEPMALRSYAILFIGIIAYIVATRHLERIARVSFLESHLIVELAERDPLTGTRNRRVFDERLPQLWQQAIDTERSLAILIIDIDHFKAYNDHYGHQAGDQTLRRVAHTVQKFIRRPFDILTRYGGEEFAAILYDVDGTQAREIAERVRRAVGEMAIAHSASPTTSLITISVGVASIQPTKERDPCGAVQLADQALYEAKVQGRNRVQLMDSAQHSLLETGVFTLGSAVIGPGAAAAITGASGTAAGPANIARMRAARVR